MFLLLALAYLAGAYPVTQYQVQYEPEEHAQVLGYGGGEEARADSAHHVYHKVHGHDEFVDYYVSVRKAAR